MSEPKSWEDWNKDREIQQRQWQADEDRIHQPIHPPTDLPVPSNSPGSPFPVSSPGSDDDYYDGSGGGGSSGEPIDPARFFSGLAFLAALPAWPVLYAIPVSIALALSFMTYGALATKLGIDRPGGKLAIGLLAGAIGLIVVVILARADHRLARSRGWWLLRHLVRIGLFTFLAHLYAATELWPHHPETSPVPGLELFRKPEYLAGLGAVAILVHVILTRRGLRDWWHRKLEAVLLRPA